MHMSRLSLHFVSVVKRSSSDEVKPNNKPNNLQCKVVYFLLDIECKYNTRSKLGSTVEV